MSKTGEEPEWWLRQQELRKKRLSLLERSKRASQRSKELLEKFALLTYASRLVIEKGKACVLKTCGACGKKYTPSEWFALPIVGYQITEHVGGEMRNCSCKSTLLALGRRRS